MDGYQIKNQIVALSTYLGILSMQTCTLNTVARFMDGYQTKNQIPDSFINLFEILSMQTSTLNTVARFMDGYQTKNQIVDSFFNLFWNPIHANLHPKYRG